MVQVAIVQRGSEEVTFEWLATLDGSTNAEIRPQITGTITAVDYQEGTVVQPGTSMFTIDRRPFVAAVEVARGNHQAAIAQLGKARADVARYTPLVAERAVSREQLANAQAAVNVALGEVQQTTGALDSARLNLAWTDVRSPIRGLAGIAQTRVGNLVGPSQVLAVVSTLDPIRASFSISQREYLEHAEILNHINDPKYVDRRYFELILLDGKVYPQRAKRVIVNRQIDPTTGTLQIQGLFPNSDHVLRPGLFAKIRLHTGVQRETVLVPARAVQQLQGTSRVAVVGPGDRIELSRIEVGPSTDHDFVARSGLEPGQRVVVKGQEGLQPGQVVRVEPAAPGVPPAPDAGVER